MFFFYLLNKKKNNKYLALPTIYILRYFNIYFFALHALVNPCMQYESVLIGRSVNCRRFVMLRTESSPQFLNSWF